MLLKYLFALGEEFHGPNLTVIFHSFLGKTIISLSFLPIRTREAIPRNFKDTVTFYIIISRIIFFLTVILYDMISKTFRNPE